MSTHVELTVWKWGKVKIETLNILIDHSKPTKLNTVGKVDKKIVKALIKVIIDDTEYEIVARNNYLNFLFYTCWNNSWIF